MKNGKLEIEFITHCLSSGNRDNVSDRFMKDSENNIVWNQSWWYSALTNAILQSGSRDVKPGHFNFNPTVSARTQLYRRKYSGDKFRTHEAIMPGVKVTFEFVAPDHLTESMIREVMDYLGKYVGLSPYGYKLGYGKFKVVNLELAKTA
jgi:hypothetical protein